MMARILPALAVLLGAGLCTAATIKTLRSSFLGVDFGSEYVKSMTAVPGMGLDVVLDQGAERKVPSVTGFGQDQREFGNVAAYSSIQKPSETFLWMYRLLGKPFGCALQQQLIDDGYPYKFVSTNRSTIAVEHNGATYSVEELIGMQMRHLKLNAKVFGIDVGSVVFTVPVFYSQTERQAVYNAAMMTFPAVTVIDDNSAAAIKYGSDRFQDMQSANITQLSCIFNVGASSTSATIVQYSSYKARSGFIPQVETLGYGFDDTLGGHNFDMRVANRLTEEFQKQLTEAGENVDIRSLPKALARLRDAGKRTKEKLSSGEEYSIKLEGLYKQNDFVYTMKREVFYELCKDLFERIEPVLSKAFADANVNRNDVISIVTIGGGSRIPKIQEIACDAAGKQELDFTVNADEGIAFGASLVGANNSASFRTRPFGYIEKTKIPIGIRLTELPGLNDAESRSKRFSVFSKSARTGSSRYIDVPWNSDVRVDIFYDESKSLPSCASHKISSYDATNISSAFAELKQHGEPQVQLTFHVKLDGMVVLESGEVSVKTTVMEPSNKPKSKKKQVDDKSESGEGGAEVEPAMRSVSKVFKRPVQIKLVSQGDTGMMTAQDLNTSIAVLDALDAKDQHFRDLSLAKNRVEEHFLSVRHKMEDDKDVQSCSTDAARAAIIKQLDDAEEWFNDNFLVNDISVFTAKLAELENLSKDIFFRVKEKELRPVAVQTLTSSLENAVVEINSLRAKEWIPQVLIESLEKTMTETKEWLSSKSAEQNAKSLLETPVFLASEVDEKEKELQKSIKMLKTIPKPMPKPAPKPAEKNASDTSNRDGGSNDKETRVNASRKANESAKDIEADANESPEIEQFDPPVGEGKGAASDVEPNSASTEDEEAMQSQKPEL